MKFQKATGMIVRINDKKGCFLAYVFDVTGASLTDNGALMLRNAKGEHVAGVNLDAVNHNFVGPISASNEIAA